MGDGLLEFIFKSKDQRKKVAYFLLAVVLTSLISAKIYVRTMGDFSLFMPNDLIKLKDYLLSGRLIIVIIIFLSIYKFFYSAIDFIITKKLMKWSDKIYDYFKYNFNREEIVSDFKTSKFLQKVADKGIDQFKQVGFIDLDKKKNIISPGLNFYKLLKFFRKLKKDEETIDTDLAYYPIGITLQILMLFNCVVTDHYEFSCWKTVLINCFGILIFLYQTIVLFINVFADLKQDKILAFLEKTNKTKKIPDKLN